MYVYSRIQFCVEAYTTPTHPHTHSMEYYFRLHLSQYGGDSLEAGPFEVCFVAEAMDLLLVRNIRPALGTSGLPFSECYLWILPQC